VALREGDERPADTDAAVLGVGDQHPELARGVGERLDPDGADDPVTRGRHGDLPRRDEPGHLRRRRSRRAVAPEPVLGGRVDTVDQLGQLFDQTGVLAGRRGQETDIDAVFRSGHASRMSRGSERRNT
jgi:hypothetical protein